MSRSLSAHALSELFKQETGEAILFLIVINHADFGTPIRLVNNNINIVSNGDTYHAFPIDVELPDEGETRPSPARLLVCNVDRQIMALMRPLNTRATCDVSIIFGTTPDTIEAGPFAFELVKLDYDQYRITAELAYEDVLNEPIPAFTFNPTHYPGAF